MQVHNNTSVSDQACSSFSDLHTRNLAFTIPSVHALREEEFLQKLGGVGMGPVKGIDQRQLEPGMPQYLVKPAAYPMDPDTSFESIKIVDFGQSFLNHESPSKVSPPLIVRAPEIIFKDKVDHRMDLWSMGCIVSLPQGPSATTSTEGTLMISNSSLNLSSDNRCSIQSRRHRPLLSAGCWAWSMRSCQIVGGINGTR